MAKKVLTPEEIEAKAAKKAAKAAKAAKKEAAKEEAAVESAPIGESEVGVAIFPEGQHPRTLRKLREEAESK